MTDSPGSYRPSKRLAAATRDLGKGSPATAATDNRTTTTQRSTIGGEPQGTPTTIDSSSRNIAADSIGKTIRTRAARRSLSGIPLTCLFETKFKHFKAFQAAQRDSSGLNFLIAPPSGAIYRSSMPVTPIATPLSSGYGLRFTEQSLQNRILIASQSSSRWSGRFTPRSTFQQTHNTDLKEEPESNAGTSAIESKISDSQNIRSRTKRGRSKER